MANPFQQESNLNKDLERDTIFGLHPGVPTGRILPDTSEGLFIEVQLEKGLKQYCRYMFPFMSVGVPTEEWLDKYKKSLMCYVGFEKGIPERPVIVGFFFKSNKQHDLGDYPNQVTTITEKFVVSANDKKEEYAIKQTEGKKQAIQIEKESTGVRTDSFYVGSDAESAKESFLLGNAFAKLFKAFIDELGTVSAIATPVGPTGPLSGSPQYAALATKYKEQIDTCLSTIAKLEK